MSDDEEYYDDYEIIWIEDPEPTIADNLAETAHYDSVPVDDPSFDVEDYFSDWEDMSDEYYDNEPTIVKRLKMSREAARLGSASQRATTPTAAISTSKNQPKTASQSHKDRADTGLRPRTWPSSAMSEAIDSASFQSVIWKAPRVEEKQSQQLKFHIPGEGEKVALLKNWREVFKLSHPSVDRSRRRANPLVAIELPVAPADMLDDDSDQTSSALSLDNLRESEMTDPIDASNSTPVKSVSPHITEDDAADEPDSGMVDAHLKPKPVPRSDVFVEIVVPRKEASTHPEAPPPRRRGRKRKAETELAPAPVPAPAPAPAVIPTRAPVPASTPTTEDISQSMAANPNKRPRPVRNTRQTSNNAAKTEIQSASKVVN